MYVFYVCSFYVYWFYDVFYLWLPGQRWPKKEVQTKIIIHYELITLSWLTLTINYLRPRCGDCIQFRDIRKRGVFYSPRVRTILALDINQERKGSRHFLYILFNIMRFCFNTTGGLSFCFLILYKILHFNFTLTLPTSTKGRRIMMTSSNENIFRVTGHLRGEFTGLRWIPHTKASDAELWSASE